MIHIGVGWFGSWLITLLTKTFLKLPMEKILLEQQLNRTTSRILCANYIMFKFDCLERFYCLQKTQPSGKYTQCLHRLTNTAFWGNRNVFTQKKMVWNLAILRLSTSGNSYVRWLTVRSVHSLIDSAPESYNRLLKV